MDDDTCPICGDDRWTRTPEDLPQCCRCGYIEAPSDPALAVDTDCCQ